MQFESMVEIKVIFDNVLEEEAEVIVWLDESNTQLMEKTKDRKFHAAMAWRY